MAVNKPHSLFPALNHLTISAAPDGTYLLTLTVCQSKRPKWWHFKFLCSAAVVPSVFDTGVLLPPTVWQCHAADTDTILSCGIH